MESECVNAEKVINAEPFQQKKTDKHTSLSYNFTIYILRGFIARIVYMKPDIFYKRLQNII